MWKTSLILKHCHALTSMVSRAELEISIKNQPRKTIQAIFCIIESVSLKILTKLNFSIGS